MGGVHTPKRMANNLYNKNKNAVGNGDINVLKGDWENYNNGSGSVRGLIEKNIGEPLKRWGNSQNKSINM